MSLAENKNRIDLWLLIPVLLLIFGSIAVVYSASSSFAGFKYNDSSMFLRQHATRVLIAVICIFAFTKIDYKIIQQYGKLMLWVSVTLLLSIFVIGVDEVKGAARWIRIGPISFQPSDIAKFALIIYLSALLVKKKDYLHWLYKGYLPIFFYIVLVTGLVLLQPNLSTAIVIFTTSLLLLLMTKVRVKHIVYSVAALVPFAVIFILSKDYIIGRLTSHAEYT